MGFREVDYKYWASLDTWTLAEALNIMAEWSINDLILDEKAEFDKRLSVEKESLKLKLYEYFELFSIFAWPKPFENGAHAYGEDGEELYDLDFDKTIIDVKKFLRWYYRECHSLHDEFVNILRSDDDMMSEQYGNKEEKLNKMEEIDVKYPTYKYIKLKNIDEKKFQQMKKYYGMLQNEEKKWRRAIPIAAKIGILFYECGLDVPITRKAFLEKYKEEFDKILKNDTVANFIYDNLPEYYRKGSGPPVSYSSIDTIINAAVFAGSQAGARDSMNFSTLKKSMNMESFVVPTDDILDKIIASVKNLNLDDDE